MLNGILAVAYLGEMALCAAQLARIAAFGHRKASYISAFLLLCLLWTGLRTFTFGLVTEDVVDVPFWLLLLLQVLPINIQFATFSLLVLFFGRVVHSQTWELRQRVWFFAVWSATNIVLLMLAAIWIALTSGRETEDAFHYGVRQMFTAVVFLLLVAVLTHYGVLLAHFIAQHEAHGAQSVAALAVRGRSRRSILLLTAAILVIFVSRCSFDIVAAFTGYRINADQTDAGQATAAFVVFIVWEIVPALSVIVFFWHIPRSGLPAVAGERQPLLTPTSPSANRDGVEAAGAHGGLFQNPNRYDMAEDDTVSALGTSLRCARCVAAVAD